jgi:hypothetical protein
MPGEYFGYDEMGLDDFGLDQLGAGESDAENQLAEIFGTDMIGLDEPPDQGAYGMGADGRHGRGWHVEGTLNALMADALAADMMFGAASPKARTARRRYGAALQRFRNPRQRPAVSPQMQMLQRMAMARQAGKMTFSSTGEQNTNIKAEILPIPRTIIPLNSQATIAVRPIRSMQINTVRFPSDRAATAVCRVEDISILGLSQLNGPGGVACSGLTEVRTAPILKGATAQAGQDILVTISNTSAANQTIEGWFEGPDLVRTT